MNKLSTPAGCDQESTPARLLTLRLNQLLFHVTKALLQRIERITRRKILLHDKPLATDLLCFGDEHRKIKVTMTDFSHKRRVVMLSRDPVVFHVKAHQLAT